MSSVLLFCNPLISSPLLADEANAAPAGPSGNDGVQLAPKVKHSRVTHLSHAKRAARLDEVREGGALRGARVYRMSCVPFARQISGIMVAGNAWQWWHNAEGVYARGELPEPGAVLNFRANGRMRLGHVAVVTRIVNPREIIIDQANWPSAASGRGGISHDVAVVDVSEANNWSAVRVELGRGADFGSVYPTYGFIYNRPDTGFVTAAVNRPAPQPVINRVPSDLRPVAERPWHTLEEVAEAPPGPRRPIDMRITAPGSNQ